MKQLLFSLCFFSLLIPHAWSGNNNTVTKYRDHLRNQRYGEILVVTGGPLVFTGHVYNTIGLNDCPEKWWKSLDPQQIKKTFKAKSVILNGPRYFLMDRNALQNPGGVADFQGEQLRHLANVRLPLLRVLQGRSKPYTENRVMRTSEYLYRPGNRIYELVSPEGHRYVMQSYAQIVDPELNEPALKDLGEKLKLPKGWKYESRVLTRPLILRTSGVAYVLQDELLNSYQRAE